MSTKKFTISKSESVNIIIETCFENKVTQHMQLACVLANCEHETGGFVFSEEIDGRAQALKLGYRGGIEYFGRGYIHLTHIDNYREVDNKLGLGGKLINNLDIATDPKIAATIATIGMRDGWFTSLGLKRWIDGDKGWINPNHPYYYARQIVNGDFKTTHTSKLAKIWSDKLPSIVDKIDGFSVLQVNLVDLNKNPSAGSLIEIIVIGYSDFSQEYTTNNEGNIPLIYVPQNANLSFMVNNNKCSDNLLIDTKLKSITLIDTQCRFKTNTELHQIEKDEQKNLSNDTKSSVNEDSSASEAVKEEYSNTLTVAKFNIKLVEEDTGKPLPNQTYYLDYKNNIKPHKTDVSGMDNTIRADVCQSISVLLDDDDGKRQSIYSMAFPVTADLNNQTKILKVPIVSFSIRFVDENDKVIPNYAFKTIYRDRESKLKNADSQGITQLKALAGQKIMIVDAKGRAIVSSIVTDGSLKWNIRINSSVLEESKVSPKSLDVVNNETASADDEKSSEDNSTPEPKVEKNKIKERDSITEAGPTRHVESNVPPADTTFIIKFIDEVTKKPLSGISYITKSTYGDNNSFTGTDGSKGTPHKAAVGVAIAVYLTENDRKREIDSFTVIAGDKVYTYETKKPKFSGKWRDPLKHCQVRRFGYRSLPLKKGASTYNKHNLKETTGNASRFGMTKYRNVGKHQGIDLEADPNTPIYAVCKGQVVHAGSYGSGKSYGKAIIIECSMNDLPPEKIKILRNKLIFKGNKIYFVYCHLNKINVGSGDEIIDLSQPIGLSGNSGNANNMTSVSNGAHLHFEVRDNNTTSMSRSGLNYRYSPFELLDKCYTIENGVK